MNTTMTSEVVLPESILPLDMTKFRPSVNVPNPMPYFDAKFLLAYAAETHRQNHRTSGHGLRMALANMQNLNIEVLQLIMSNPYTFPLDWTEKKDNRPSLIFFWGTILHDEDGVEYVPCLWWDKNAPHAGVRSLDSMWDRYSYAAQCAA